MVLPGTRLGKGPKIRISPNRATGCLPLPTNHSTCWWAVAKSLRVSCKDFSLPGWGMGRLERSSPITLNWLRVSANSLLRTTLRTTRANSSSTPLRLPR